MKQIPIRLSTTISKITSLPNSSNAALMIEFYQYMKNIVHQKVVLIIV
jgi:hypothetical protein